MADLPRIVESLTYNDIFQQKLSSFTAAYQKVNPSFKEPTAADPLYHILAELTFSELVGRERVNVAAYSQLLKFSNDIEFLLQGKIRGGESPEAFRERMRGRLNLVSPAGTAPMYRALSFLYGEATITEDNKTRYAQVIDAYIQSVSGRILIHVLMNTDATDLKVAVLSALAEAFKKETVTPALDDVSVIEARSTPFIISGSLVLKPGYVPTYKDNIIKTFQAKFQAERKLGWGPSTSWIIKELHQEGVKSVRLQSPVSDNLVLPERYASITSLNLSVEIAL